MPFKYSDYWNRKRKYRPDITDDIIEYAVKNSNEMKDRTYEERRNAISRIPPSGRLLKVVYQHQEGKIKIITAYWLD